MKRRDFLKWTTPVITAVMLPAHAQMSNPPPPCPEGLVENPLFDPEDPEFGPRCIEPSEGDDDAY